MIKSKLILTHSRNDDILLNNFQIKNKSYKVLFNCDHIVWERMNSKCIPKEEGNSEKKQTTASTSASVSTAAASTTAIQKDTEYEKEQLSHKAVYGDQSNVLYLHDVIRVSKGDTIQASMTNAHKPLATVASQLETHQEIKPAEKYLTIYYAERIISSPKDCNRWHVKRLTLHNNDPHVVTKWCDSLTFRLYKNSKRVQRLLVFINPYGGRKMGLKIYENKCKEIIQLAGIDASCIITQRANQIQDILMSHDLRPYDAVCCVGGDGTVAEMINGLIWRAIKNEGFDLRDPPYIPKPELPVAIIPAGSTDTIAYSLHGTSDPQTAAIHLVLGQRRGLDICSVSNNDGIIRFCASAMGYGYLGDVAAKSEKYRWMGTKRYEYTGIKTFLSNRGYEAKIKLLLSTDKVDNNGSTRTSISIPNENTKCNAYCQICRYAESISTTDDDNNCDDNKPGSSNLCLNEKQITDHDNNVVKLENNYNDEHEDEGNFNNDMYDMNYLKPMEEQTQINDLINSRETITTKTLSSCSSSSSINAQQQQQQQQQKQQQQQQQQDKILKEKSKDANNWRIICGEFFMITGANIACACTRSPNGISKYCHLGDGYFDVILVRKTNLFNNLRFVFNAMARNGDVRTLPFVEIYRTRELQFMALPNSVLEEKNSVRGSCQPINDSYSEEQNNTNFNNMFSTWNCDGEVVKDLEIVMSSHRQLLDVFMRGPYIYSKPIKKKKIKKSMTCCFCNS